MGTGRPRKEARCSGQEATRLGQAADAKYTGGRGGRNALACASLATLRVDGVEIPWLQAPGPAGETPVVLFAGLGWRATGCVRAGALGLDVPLVGLDYPRRWPRRPLDSMADLARLYTTALDQLGHSRVRLLGVSMGGMLALQLALDRPERVESLVLVSTAAAGTWVTGHWRIPTSRAAAALLPEGLFYHFYRTWGPLLVGTEPFLARPDAARVWTDPMGRRKLLDLLRAIAIYDVRDRLGEVRSSVLVLHGSRDRIFGMDAAQDLARGLQGSRFESIADGDHFVFLTHQERLLAELRGFWRREGGS